MSRNAGKKLISLKDDHNHSEVFQKQTQGGHIGCIYYTFKKCKRDIIWFTHRQEVAEDEFVLPDDVENVQIAQYGSDTCANEKASISSTPNESASSPRKDLSTGKNNTLRTFTVSQQRISFKEYSMMYFEYLISFLVDYMHSIIGAKKVKFCYCIIRDSYNEFDEFRLTEEDIHDIGSKCDMLSRKANESHHKLLSIERTEATALYCRDLIGSVVANDRTSDTGFIQMQLTTDQCLLLLNRIPFYEGGESDTQVENSWNIIHKYAKSKNIPFNFMDITCQNLWAHVQKYQQDLLKKCKRHRSFKRFFTASNMHAFKDLLYAYFSTVSIAMYESEHEMWKIIESKFDAYTLYVYRRIWS